MGGEVRVVSSEGEGSSFTVILPFAEAAPLAALELDPETPMAPLRGHVLLVEDNPLNREIAQLYLESFGLDVSCSESGVDVLARLRGISPDLILMDCEMPDLDGLETTRRIRRAGGSMPILAYTAHALHEQRAACFAAGMNDVLTKPLTLEALGAALHKWIPR